MRSSQQRPRDTHVSPDSTDPERHSVVTPLFAPRVEAPKRPVIHFGNVSTWKRVVAGVVALGLLAGAGWFVQQNHAQSRATERLALGCLDVSDCRTVVQNVEALRDSCWFDCSALTTIAQQARTQFRAALEQQAQRELANQDKAYQSVIQSKKSAEQEHSRLSHASRLAERDHEHRLELERIAAQTERLRQLRTTALSSQLGYFKQLTPEQRLNRLRACHKRGSSCEDLVQQLSQAAPALSEQRALIAAHEDYVTAEAVNATSKPSPAVPEPISEPTVAQRL